MMNLDLIKNSAEIKTQVIAALNDENETNDNVVALMEKLVEAKVTEYRAEMQINEHDTNIKLGRGIRQLTSEEKKYYNQFIDMAEKPKGSIDYTTMPMPTTIIESVFEDLRSNSPLLSHIDMVNTTGLTEFVVRDGDSTPAWWGELCDEIKKQLESAFKIIQVNQLKLSAFLPVCKSMLVLGPEWLDRFVREMLAESIDLGAEQGVITGTGNVEPIGMDRDLLGAVVQGVYPQKTKVALNEFSPEALGNIMVTLSNNGKRAANDLIFIVNPTDYYTKVMPALLRFVNGEYRVVSPYPVTVITSQFVAANSAIIGLGKKYFLGMGSNRVIEYSDHYKFLEDERVYITKMLANGLPKDNNAFVFLDITNLKSFIPKVQVVDSDFIA